MPDGYFVLFALVESSLKGIAGDSHLVKTTPEVNFFYEKYK